MSMATTSGLPEGSTTTLSRGSRACIDRLLRLRRLLPARRGNLVYPARGCEPRCCRLAHEARRRRGRGLASTPDDAHPGGMPGRTQTDLPVLHLVNRFWIGGAERQFIERLRLHPEGFAPVVACLELSGALLDQVQALGHLPILFPLRGSLLQANTALQIMRMAKLIRDRGVKLIHSTEFNTNLLGLAAARLAGVRCIVRPGHLWRRRGGFGRWPRGAGDWGW